MKTSCYTCFECGRDHGPKKNFWDGCPFEGVPRAPRPVPRRPTEAQLRHTAQIEARMTRDIVARQQREVEEQAERERVKTAALLNDLRQEYRGARQAEGAAIHAEVRDLLEPIQFVRELEIKCRTKRLVEKFGGGGYG
jgi:hypothetical protein